MRVPAISATPDSERAAPRKWRLPQESSILVVLVAIALVFEALGWFERGQSFLYNPQGLLIMVLRVAEIGLIAVGVTMVIIAGGIDLSSGSVVALSAMVAGSLAQAGDFGATVFPGVADLPVIVPVLAGVLVGGVCGLLNGTLIVRSNASPGATGGPSCASDRPVTCRGSGGTRGSRSWHRRGFAGADDRRATTSARRVSPPP